MKHLELHILQSVPVACLNRDDLNSPKTAIFGGVQRARVSSQSWKRAVRELAATEGGASDFFKGKRSRLFVDEIVKRLVDDKKIAQSDAMALASCAGHYLAKLDPKQAGKVKTLVFLSPLEYDSFASALHGLDKEDKAKLIDAYSRIDTAKLAEDDGDEDDGGEEDAPTQKAKGEKKLSPKQFTKVVTRILSGPVRTSFAEKPMPKDAADIAIFGRMVANDHSLTVEAASMFSHALSVHKVDNEIDFFSAVDDLQSKGEAGAGMTSTLEFNSATYYRFAALNLDMLAEDHLKALNQDERKSVVRTFVESTIKAIPGARKNTMNGNTLPIYVLAVVREKGHPIQLINAFENPIRSNQGYAAKAVELLKTEYARLKKTWGVEAALEIAVAGLGPMEAPALEAGSKEKSAQETEPKEKPIPEVGLKALLDGLVAHVN